MRVAERAPQSVRPDDLQLSRLTDGSAQQLLDRAYQLVDVDGLRIERLAARESKQAVRQGRGAV